MDKRISDFIDVTKQLVEVCHDILHQERLVRFYTDFPFLTQKVSELREKANADLHSIREEEKRLKTRLNEAAKALSKDELSKLVEAELQTCINNKTADPLLWICGLDLNELPEGTTFEANYSPDTRIAIEVDSEYDYENEEAVNHLFFRAKTTGEKEHSMSSSYFTLYDMEADFRYILKEAEHIREEVLGEDTKIEESTNANNNEIKALKERLTEVKHIFLHQDEPQFDNVDWDSVAEEFFLLKTRMEDVLKTLSEDEVRKLVEADLQACIDNKTAEPLLWIGGLDLDEIPMPTETWVYYAPGVDISLETSLDLVLRHNAETGKYSFSYPDGADRHALYLSVQCDDFSPHPLILNLFDMEEILLRTLETAEYEARYHAGDMEIEELEDEELDKISAFVSLKERLTKAYFHSPLTPLEMRLLEARLNSAVRELPTDKFAKIVEKDLQTCVDNKTTTPLLWMCGLDLDEIPMGTTFEANYSPDTRIAIEVGGEMGKDKGLYLTVDIDELYLYVERFDRSDMGEKFRDALEKAENGKAIIAELDEPTDEELEDEEPEL